MWQFDYSYSVCSTVTVFTLSTRRGGDPAGGDPARQLRVEPPQWGKIRDPAQSEWRGLEFSQIDFKAKLRTRVTV